MNNISLLLRKIVSLQAKLALFAAALVLITYAFLPNSIYLALSVLFGGLSAFLPTYLFASLVRYFGLSLAKLLVHELIKILFSVFLLALFAFLLENPPFVQKLTSFIRVRNSNIANTYAVNWLFLLISYFISIKGSFYILILKLCR